MHPEAIDWSAYALAASPPGPASQLSSPRLLVYRDKAEANIALMRRHLEAVVPGSGFRHLAPHLKTHKSLWATRLLLQAGIERVKCSLQELDLALAAELLWPS